jgi:aspartate kinase
VLHLRSVRFAMRYGVRVHVRSSFTEREGTWVVPEGEVMEGRFVSGVTYNRDEAKIRVRGVKDQPGIAGRIFAPLAEAGIVVDMIIQNLSQDGTTDLTFTVSQGDYRRARARRAVGRDRRAAADGDEELPGADRGPRHEGPRRCRHAHVPGLGERHQHQLISTSEVKVSVVIERSQMERAVRALHAAFLEAGAAEPREER